MNKWRLMEHIEKAGFTQKSFAKELGLSPATLNYKVNGRSCFNTDEVKIICDKLHIVDNLEKCEIFLS